MVPKDPLRLKPALNPPVPGGGRGNALSCLCMWAKSLQSRLTLCDPRLSRVHGMLQARMLKWSELPLPPLVDLPHSGVRPVSLHLWHCQAGSLPLLPPGKPLGHVCFEPCVQQGAVPAKPQLKGFQGLPGDSGVKDAPASAGDAGSHPWVGKIPRRKRRQPAPVFLPGKSHGPRSLVSYRPWGRRVRHNVATEQRQQLVF